MKKQTIRFKNQPCLISGYTIVGKKEGEGIFSGFFDKVLENDFFEEKTFEKAERKMIEHSILGAVKKSGIGVDNIDIILAGDLLNQIISSSYAARQFSLPYLGLFGACSTMAESLALGALLVDGGYFNNVACATASHFSTAERQFRFPLELGNQRVPTSQWTVTGAGASIISKKGRGPKITMATFGKVVDYNIKDANNMGAAMAPSAMDTLIAHFKDTRRTPDYYDLIVTGDLGKLGSDILLDLMENKGFKFGVNYADCGHIYYTKDQEVMSGGSGCGCSATVLNSYILKKMNEKVLNKVLFVPTGALMSTTASFQGESIPGISHAIALENI